VVLRSQKSCCYTEHQPIYQRQRNQQTTVNVILWLISYSFVFKGVLYLEQHYISELLWSSRKFFILILVIQCICVLGMNEWPMLQLFKLHQSIHPFIFYTHLLQFRVAGGGWSLSQLSLGERQGTPWMSVHHRATQRQTNITLTPREDLESHFNLTCIFLDGGRKPERTHAYTGRTCKLHTERPQLGFEHSCCANHHTIVQPITNSLWVVVYSQNTSCNRCRFT